MRRSRGVVEDGRIETDRLVLRRVRPEDDALALLAMLSDERAAGLAFLTATHDELNPASGAVMRACGLTYRYSYRELWQPKNYEVTFRMHQVDLVPGRPSAGRTSSAPRSRPARAGARSSRRRAARRACRTGCWSACSTAGAACSRRCATAACSSTRRERPSASLPRPLRPAGSRATRRAPSSCAATSSATAPQPCRTVWPSWATAPRGWRRSSVARRCRCASSPAGAPRSPTSGSCPRPRRRTCPAACARGSGGVAAQPRRCSSTGCRYSRRVPSKPSRMASSAKATRGSVLAALACMRKNARMASLSRAHRRSKSKPPWQ